MAELVVVKVGGSLFDLPDLGPRLRLWLDTTVQAPTRVLLVPGGGPTADVIREFDRVHGLGEEASHVLAFRALSLNAHVLAHLLPAAVIVSAAPPTGVRVAILDAFAFLQADEARHGTTIPHTWAASSDTVAARVAIATQARRLILLKSVTIPKEVSDWEAVARSGVVDPVFASLLRQAAALEVSTFNLREWQPSGRNS